MTIRSMDTATLFKALDDLSRKRALTDAESLLLQRTQNRLKNSRASYGSNKELARHGVRRMIG